MAQEMLFLRLVAAFMDAKKAGDVYETTGWHRELMLQCTIEEQGKKRTDAFKLLHDVWQY